MVRAVRLLARYQSKALAESLRAVHGVLRSQEVDDGVVDCQNDKGLHNGCNEQGLRRGAALFDLEQPDPEEADSHRGDACNGAAEEEKDQKGHEDVVHGESLGGFYKDPVHRLEDVDVT